MVFRGLCEEHEAVRGDNQVRSARQHGGGGADRKYFPARANTPPTLSLPGVLLSFTMGCNTCDLPLSVSLLVYGYHYKHLEVDFHRPSTKEIRYFWVQSCYQPDTGVQK